MGTLKRRLFYPLYVLVSVMLIFLAIELVLTIIHSVTGDTRLGTLRDDEGLTEPEKHFGSVKIALFGGSSAAGVNSLRGFDDVLLYELSERYPDRNFFVKNYAIQGDTFHNSQAEIIKAVISQFDLILIYAGHNEAWNYWDGTGYFMPFDSDSGKKESQSWPATKRSGERSLLDFIYDDTQLMNLTRKINHRTVKPFLSNLLPMIYEEQQLTGPKRNELSGTLSSEQIAVMARDFKRDLEEIAGLASKYGTIVIFSSVPSNQNYQPSFSQHNPNLTSFELSEFDKHFDQGMAQYDQGSYSSAITLFMEAYRIDDEFAMLNHMIGKSYLKIGETRLGRDFLQQSVDHDKFIIRSPTAMRQVPAQVSVDYPDFYFVDTVETFYQLLDEGVNYDDLFADAMHPSFLGHIVISRNFLLQIGQLDLFLGEQMQEEFPLDTQEDIQSILEYYTQKLAVSEEEERWLYWKLSRHHAGIGGFGSGRNKHFDMARSYLEDYYATTNKSTNDTASYLLFSSLIEAKIGNTGEALVMGNQALDLAPEYIDEVLHGKWTPYGVIYRDRFADLGFVYLREQKAFALSESNN